ncbi:MAG: PDZ domain-containing protein [Blastocatellales bacterium]
MTTCRACSSEIIGPDRYCRNCGAPVAPTVAEFDDTRRFNPSVPLPVVAPGPPDTTNPLYAPPFGAYATPQGSAQLRQTESLVKRLLKRKIVRAMMIFVTLIIIFGVGIGIGSSMNDPGPAEWLERDRARGEVEDRIARHKYEEAVQNALGFKQGEFTASDFPGAQGIFVNSLMSDDSPAALSKIQAGDLITELKDQAVRNSSELKQALDSLKTGDEVPVKVYRDGAVVSARIKIADRAFPPLQPKTEADDQGFLGILDSTRRCCVPGTKKWGVEVDELHVNGSAELFGLRPGDLITEFNGYPVKTPNEFNRRIRAVKPRSKVLVTFYRGGGEQKIEVIIGHRW